MFGKELHKEVFGKVPYIGVDGVVELGKCIDFHSTIDFDVRLIVDTNSLHCSTNFKVGGGSIYSGSYQLDVG